MFIVANFFIALSFIGSVLQPEAYSNGEAKCYHGSHCKRQSYSHFGESKCNPSGISHSLLFCHLTILFFSLLFLVFAFYILLRIHNREICRLLRAMTAKTMITGVIHDYFFQKKKRKIILTFIHEVSSMFLSLLK